MLVGDYVGLGTSTLEAMLLGLPVISNVPENLFNDALLKDMESYVYTNDSDIRPTVDKIIQLLENKDLRKSIGQNGREFVFAVLNWEKIGLMYSDVFNQVINQK